MEENQLIVFIRCFAQISAVRVVERAHADYERFIFRVSSSILARVSLSVEFFEKDTIVITANDA